MILAVCYTPPHIHMDSMWSPCGLHLLHVDSCWSPQYVYISSQSPHGLPVESKWTSNGIYMLLIKFTRSPSGLLMEYTRSPQGIFYTTYEEPNDRSHD